MTEHYLAVIGIIVEDRTNAERLNALISEYGQYIIGRMGVPYRPRAVNIISIAIDAPKDIINALSGKIGKIEGISVKTAYSKKVYTDETPC
ncbi:MAG: iron-only hydrogenase system regulator [Actinomycetaceae bacterium]|nr:iron-only hydrogenase system regulator [Actinomycetaceae bacterium]